MTPTDLRTLLVTLGLTTGAAARLCGVQSRTVRYWLAGEKPISTSAWLLLCLVRDVEGARPWLETETARRA